MQLLSATLAYPAVLLVLALGCGLLIDGIAQRFLPAVLLPTIGFALIVCVTQLVTWSPATARATPSVLVAVAAVGFAISTTRLRTMLARLPKAPWPAIAMLGAYAIAIAPVVLAGRTTLTGYLLDTTTASHLAGADYLLHHGRDFGRLDLNTSYGGYLQGYFGTGYPSGGHTALGGTAALIPIDFIWLYQPYLAFLLGLGVGPLTVLLRRVGLVGVWGAVAALVCAVPALVYAYQLVGSIKELTALPMILATGALVTLHGSWVVESPRRAVPFAVVAAAGIGAVGVSFGAWIIAAVAVLLAITASALRSGAATLRAVLSVAIVGVGVVIVGALPVVQHVGASLRSARGIALTNDPGNLLQPLKPVQALGVWIGGSYREDPVFHPVLTYTLIGVLLVAAVSGVIELGRARHWSLLAWVALLGLLWWQLTERGTTWTDAKLILLSSSVVVMLTWVSVAGLRHSGRRLEALLLGAAISGGVLYSDAEQYHNTTLAPTGRINELRDIGKEFAGRGPTLIPDFDEYSMYLMRRMGVSGPGLAFKPAALAAAGIPYGYPADLDQLDPKAYAIDRLIVMRRSPSVSRPPSDFTLRKMTRWYEVWERSDAAPRVRAHLPLLNGLQPSRRPRCQDVRRVAHAAGSGSLIAATRPPALSVVAADARHSPGWSPLPGGALLLTTPGRFQHGFDVPATDRWQIWVKGQFGRALTVFVDGREVGEITAQTGGLGNFAPPVDVRLERGRHRVALVRGGGTLGPGNGAYTQLDAVVLTPGGTDERESLISVAPKEYRKLCDRPADWIEAVA